MRQAARRPLTWSGPFPLGLPTASTRKGGFPGVPSLGFRPLTPLPFQHPQPQGYLPARRSAGGALHIVSTGATSHEAGRRLQGPTWHPPPPASPGAGLVLLMGQDLGEDGC